MNSPINIVILCETFLMPDKVNHISIPGYCLITKNRTNKKDGGVSILINNKLMYKLQNDINESNGDFLESVFIEIEMKLHKSIVVGSLYRVPIVHNVSLTRNIKNYYKVYYLKLIRN